jgi:hypothetical protein
MNSDSHYSCYKSVLLISIINLMNPFKMSIEILYHVTLVINDVLETSVLTTATLYKV